MRDRSGDDRRSSHVARGSKKVMGPQGTLLCNSRNPFNVDGLLRRIKFANQLDMDRREFLNGFGVFDNPDSLITVRYKDGSLRLPFRVPYGGTSPPAFLHAVCSTRLCVFLSATLVTDPPGTRCVRLLS